jgi:hypothetical protein
MSWVFNGAINQKQTPAFYADTLANRPVAGYNGRIFFATDSPYGIFRDNGTTWTQIAANSSGTVTGSGTIGQVSFWNSVNSLSGSNNLFWDNTNGYLGIGTNLPNTNLDINGTVNQLLHLNNTTTANSNIAYQNQGATKWRVGNFYNAGANDFTIYDNLNSTNRLSISNAGIFTFTGSGAFSQGITAATGNFSSSSIIATNGVALNVENNATSFNTLQVKNSGSGNIATFFNSSNTGITISNNGSLTAFSIIKAGGTSTQFLKADGSSDSNTYLTSSSAASTYLPLSGGTLTGALNGTSAIFTGQLNLLDTTQSTSSNTGSLVVYGGLGIAKNIFSNGSFVSNGASLAALNGGDIQVYTAGNANFFSLTSPTNGNFLLKVNQGLGAINALNILNTGVATFSSRVNVNGATDNASFQLNVLGSGFFSQNLQVTLAISAGTVTTNNYISVVNNDQTGARYYVQNTGSGGSQYALMAGNNNVDNTGFSLLKIGVGNILRFDSSNNATFSNNVTAESSAQIGKWIGIDYAYFGHPTRNNATDYSLIQSAAGQSILNSVSTLYLRTGGTSRLDITSTTAALSVILNSTTRINVNGAADNSLFSLNNGGGTLYTNGFSPNATNYTGNITLGGGSTYINLTVGLATWTLPTPSGNNQMYFIKNAGTGILTLNAFSAGGIIDLTNAAVSSVALAVGQTLIIQQDGNAKSYIIK